MTEPQSLSPQGSIVLGREWRICIVLRVPGAAAGWEMLFEGHSARFCYNLEQQGFISCSHHRSPVGLLEASLCITPDLSLQSRLMAHHCLRYVCERVLAGITLVTRSLPATHWLDLVI